MAAVNELIVREYFEMLGYLVAQPRKSAASGKSRMPGEDIDLLISNPRVKEDLIPEHVVWTSDDFSGIARAVVGVRGWHTDRFYMSTFEKAPEVFRFADSESIRFAAKFFGSDAIARIMCVPRLPATGELKDKTIAALRARGIHGIISFETILADLVSGVDVRKNYDRSDLLQMIRILKNYRLLNNGQMDLFASRNRKAK